MLRIGTLLVGGLIGAGLAMLMAPRTGIESQADLRRRARQMRDQYGDLVEQGRLRATELIQTGRDVLDERMPQVRDMVNTAVDRTRQMTQPSTTTGTPGQTTETGRQDETRQEPQQPM